MPLYCESGSTICRANRHTVKGQLQAPAQYDPVNVPPPPGANKAGCTSASLAPQWVVRSFRYEEKRNWRSQQANATAPPPTEWKYKPDNALSLDLLNKANDYAVSCHLRIPTNATTDNSWQRCFPDTGRAQYYVETYVRFNPATAQLNVNQTWFCSDTDASQPILYEGAFTLRVPYCGEATEIQRDVCERRAFPRGCDMHSLTRWCQTGRYNLQSITFEPANVSVTGTTARTSLLPANALVDPDPDPNVWSCTVDSLGKPVTWTLSQFRPEGFFFTYWLYMSAISPVPSALSFDFANSAFARRPGGGLIPHVEARTSALTPFTPEWRPDTSYGQLDDPWWALGFGGHFPFDNALSWRMRFDAATGYLELNHVWYCNDKNPDTPLLFNGTWAGRIDMNCRLNDIDKNDPDYIELGCHLPNGSVTVRPRVYSQRLRNMGELPR